MKINKNIWSNTRASKNEDEEEEDQSSEFISYASSSLTIQHLKVYLDEGIRSAKFYRPLIEHMSQLSEDDQVTININTHGGDLAGAMALINAIDETEAHVVANIAGACISGGTLIALSCPGVTVAPEAYMMFHSCSFGSGGKQENVESHVNFFSPKVKKYMKRAYEDFLTPKEIQEVFSGSEIWIDTNDIHARLELRQKKQEEAQNISVEVPTSMKKATKARKIKD